ncbi:MAG: DUF5940 domain-containing protein [Proteobacteria bacterium]|nr:DUF5940 domain-containing protein [Pseudomonadota bacterium]
MPGFAPTQGHSPSAVPYIGHAIASMREQTMRRAMFLGKASLLMGCCTGQCSESRSDRQLPVREQHSRLFRMPRYRNTYVFRVPDSRKRQPDGSAVQRDTRPRGQQHLHSGRRRANAASSCRAKLISAASIKAIIAESNGM